MDENIIDVSMDHQFTVNSIRQEKEEEEEEKFRQNCSFHQREKFDAESCEN